MWKWLIALAIFLTGALSGYLFALYGSEIWPRQLGYPSCPHSVRTVDLSVRNGEIYRVRKVVDGDTVVLDNGLHLRYLGVNAPETGHFVKDAAPLGIEATQRNIQLVEGRRVRLTLPKDPLDNYGRLVGHIEVVPEDAASTDANTKTDVIDPQRTLLREGLAKLMGMGLDHEQLAEFRAIEADAKARKVGIWGLEDKARLEGAGKPYVAAEKGTVYHLRLCKTAHSIRTANLHEYASAEQAEQAGFKACPRCVLKEP